MSNGFFQEITNKIVSKKAKEPGLSQKLDAIITHATIQGLLKLNKVINFNEIKEEMSNKPQQSQFAKMPNPQQLAAKVIGDGKVLEQTVTTTLTAVDKPKDDDSIKAYWIQVDDPQRSFLDVVQSKPSAPEISQLWGPGRYIISPIDVSGNVIKEKEERVVIGAPGMNNLRQIQTQGQQMNNQNMQGIPIAPVVIQPPQLPVPPPPTNDSSDYMRMVLANKAADEERRERELAERRRMEEERKREEDRKKEEREEERRREDAKRDEERKREELKRDEDRKREEAKREEDRRKEEAKRDEELRREEKKKDEEAAHKRKIEEMRLELEKTRIEDERKREDKERERESAQRSRDEEFRRILMEKEQERKDEQRRRDEEYRRDREERESQYRRDREEREDRERKDREKREEQERKDKLFREEQERKEREFRFEKEQKEREERERREKEERIRIQDEISRRDERERKEKAERDEREANAREKRNELLMQVGGMILPVLLPVIADRMKKDPPIEPPPPFMPPQEDSALTSHLLNKLDRLEDKINEKRNDDDDDEDFRPSRKYRDEPEQKSNTEEVMQLLRMGMEMGKSNEPKEEKKTDLIERLIGMAPTLIPMLGNLQLAKAGVGQNQAQDNTQVNQLAAQNNQLAEQNRILLDNQKRLASDQQILARRLESSKEIKEAKSKNRNEDVEDALTQSNDSERKFTEEEVKEMFGSTLDSMFTNPDALAAYIKSNPKKFGPSVLQLIEKHGMDIMQTVNQSQNSPDETAVTNDETANTEE